MATSSETVRGLALRWPTADLADRWRPDAAQRAVVGHRGGHLRVLAGPGTGKTAALAGRAARLLGDGLPAEALLILTFNRMSAEHLRRQLARMVSGSALPVVTTFHALAYRLAASSGDPLRILGGPQQEAVLREVVSGSAHIDGSLRQAQHTSGLASEVADFISRAQALGLRPEVIAPVEPHWDTAAHLYGEYLDVVGLAGAVDYAGLIDRAVGVAREQPPDSVRALQEVLVDEFQDVDPAQARLLQALTAGGARMSVFGDPDQAIFGWRGADSEAFLRFDELFADRPAVTLALAASHRFGPAIASVARRVVPHPGMVGVPAAVLQRHRAPAPAHVVDRVAVRLYDCEGAQAEHLAEELRRVRAGTSTTFPDLRLPWSEMAVVVRSGHRDLVALQRALLAAGVPVELAADEIPLAQHPAVQPLLEALRAASGADGGLTTEGCAYLIASPLCGVEPLAQRHLAQALRQTAAGRGVDPVPGSEVLLRDALGDPRLLSGIGGPAAPLVAALGRLLARARSAASGGASAGEVLAEVWQGSGWPERLRASALGVGRAAMTAHASLDAVSALFEEADRQDRGYERVRSVAGFLEQVRGQQMPAAPSRQRAWQREAVRLLTAHRAKGTEWPLVVVAGVQEDSWPDLLPRGSILNTGWLGVEGTSERGETAGVSARKQRLLAEQRLFFVACTRARRALLITAVKGPGEADPAPSRFVAMAAGDEVPVVEVTGRPERPLTSAGVVAALRRVLADPATSPAMAEAVRDRLASLVEVTDDHRRRVFPAADPARWWGTRDWSRGLRPWFDPEAALALSASSVAEYVQCPRRWFLQRRVGVDSPRGTAAAFGTLLHACADAVGRGRVEPDAVAQVVDQAWSALDFRGPWLSRAERAEAEAATRRLLTWLASRPEPPLASEVGFDHEVELAESGERVRLRGSADWVDRASGRVVITDFKTGRTAPTADEVASDVQLGLYRFVSEMGALDTQPADSAQLLFVRLDPRKTTDEVGAKALVQSGGQVRPWLEPVLESVAAGLRLQVAVARPGTHCRTCSVADSCPAAGDAGGDSG